MATNTNQAPSPLSVFGRKPKTELTARAPRHIAELEARFPKTPVSTVATIVTAVEVMPSMIDEVEEPKQVSPYVARLLRQNHQAAPAPRKQQPKHTSPTVLTPEREQLLSQFDLPLFPKERIISSTVDRDGQVIKAQIKGWDGRTRHVVRIPSNTPGVDGLFTTRDGREVFRLIETRPSRLG